MIRSSKDAKSASNLQQKARYIAVRRSKEYRSELLDQLRDIALKTHLSYETKAEAARNSYKYAEEADIEVEFDSLPTEKKSKISSQSMKIAQFFANQMIHYDSFIDPPVDLRKNWFCMAKPEGPRALLVANQGFVTWRNKHGRFKEHFVSRYLPKELTIMDCVFDEAHQTFWVMDCLMWNGMAIADTDVECRRHMIKDRFEGEDGERLATPNPSVQRYAFRLVNLHECSLQNLLQLYHEDRQLDPEYSRDSLVFVHKTATYTSPWSPLFVQYKDYNLTRYAIDTDEMDGTQGENQIVVLKLHKNGLLLTLDNVALGFISSKTMREKKYRPGQCLKCKIISGEEGGFERCEDAPGVDQETGEKEAGDVETGDVKQREESGRMEFAGEVKEGQLSVTETSAQQTTNKLRRFGALGYMLRHPLVVESHAGKSRCVAEPFSRVLSQSLLRQQPVGRRGFFDSLLEVVSGGKQEEEIVDRQEEEEEEEEMI
eukprot:GDKK01038199.1.p1 GENE.GDKK01038199.1~~GDKK01038199.1.p1  ORF type:complete len:486 (+),score=96.66 GDKK01038199.1:38-1495(+)